MPLMNNNLTTSNGGFQNNNNILTNGNTQLNNSLLQPPSLNTVIFVSSQNEVDQYPLAINSHQIFWDVNNNVIYIKFSDVNGNILPLKIFDCTERKTPSVSTPTSIDYITSDEFDRRINELEQHIDDLVKARSPRKEKVNVQSVG